MSPCDPLSSAASTEGRERETFTSKDSLISEVHREEDWIRGSSQKRTIRDTLSKNLEYEIFVKEELMKGCQSTVGSLIIAPEKGTWFDLPKVRQQKEKSPER